MATAIRGWEPKRAVVSESYFVFLSCGLSQAGSLWPGAANNVHDLCVCLRRQAVQIASRVAAAFFPACSRPVNIGPVGCDLSRMSMGRLAPGANKAMNASILTWALSGRAQSLLAAAFDP